MKQFFKKIYRFNLQNFLINKKAYSYLKSSKNILDVGCGTGEFIKNNPQKIIGIDTNKDTLKTCKQKKFKVKTASVFKLPFKANSFTGIHCSHVIEHLQPEKAYQALKEISRVLKPKGIFVLRAPILWSGFYDNLTHIKPYPPRAITRYLVESAPDTTYPVLNHKFQQIALYWRYNLKLLQKTGYMLILKKI